MRGKGNPSPSAIRKDYVIVVGGGVGVRWLGHYSEEDDGEAQVSVSSTTDPEMAYRTQSFTEVRRVLKETAKRHPSNEFRIDVLTPVATSC
jgi:hypothetical protein